MPCIPVSDSEMPYIDLERTNCMPDYVKFMKTDTKTDLNIK